MSKIDETRETGEIQTDEARLPAPMFSLRAFSERLRALRVNRAARPTDLSELLASFITGYTPDPEREQAETSYYDYPVLKEPVWRWEIVWYFFLGGLAAGCYVIASIAALFGSKEDRTVARTGYYLSLLALLPCPLLLIKDLGRPERFLNMLLFFNVKSPSSTKVSL